jgi:hypothetical protein
MKKNTFVLFNLIVFIFSFFSPFFVIAATPTIKIYDNNGTKDSGIGKFGHDFTIQTTNIPDGEKIGVIAKKLNKSGVYEPISETKLDLVIKNNTTNYKIHPILEPSTEYLILAEYLKSGGATDRVTLVTKTLTETLPQGYITIDSTRDYPFEVTPTKDTQIKTNDTYTFLAPFGGLPDSIKTNDIGSYFNIIFKVAIGLCAGLAVIMIIIYAIQYMGDESIFGKSEAKTKIGQAIFGLIIAIGSWVLLNTINPALTGKDGVTIDPVSVDILEGTQYRLSLTQNTPEAKTFKRSSFYNQIKTISSSKNIPNCLMQVAIQRESGGISSVGHDEDVPSFNVKSRVSFVSSGKKFDGTSFSTKGEKDSKITESSFKNTDHPSNYKKALNASLDDLGLDWRFSHSIGMFGVTFGPNHLNKSGAKKIYDDPSADINKALEIMSGFYNKCNKNIEKTWRGYNSGNCDGNNNFTNKETAIRMNLYNQCVSQDK